VSLDIARIIAFGGISATELQIAVASSNIANADTPGYTQKTANQESLVTGGMGTGVSITGITSNVNKLLLKSLIGATSDLGSASTVNDYMTQLQQLFGNDTSNADGSTTGTSIANSLASLESALSSLANNPSSVALQSAVVSAVGEVASQLRETSSSIQGLRANANQDISTSVDSVNSDLKQIVDLNAEIKQGAASGQSTADLEDQRNSALQDLSSYMNVSYYTTSSGDLQVFTQSGQALVDSVVHPLSYTKASNVSASTTFSPITVNGIDVTSQITSGKIGGLLTMRDKVLPAAQSQLDELAQQLKSSLNQVSNQGTSLPPPASLTGTKTVASTDALSSLPASGTVRIAVVGQSGNLVSYQDLDLSQYSTVGDLVNAINGISGMSASVDANGHLSIAATTTGDGIAINDMTSSVGSGGQGFSSYFGLNDLVTGTGAADFAVRGDLLDGDAGLPTATLDSSATLTPGSPVLSPGSTTVIDAFTNALTAQTNFAAAGGLSATTGSFADYAAAIVSDVASKASQASSTFTSKSTAQSTYANSLSSETGVNVDEENNRVAALQNKYAATSQLIQAVNTMFNSLLTAMQTTG
jgi:flagellar hook-associated protein 1 FlgK